MSYRLSKIYTRQGDDGSTGWGQERVAKDDVLMEAMGTIDELNSTIGLILCCPIQDKTIIEQLTKIQHELFDLGGELHSPTCLAIVEDKIVRLEMLLDQWNATLPPLQEFLLPGGNPSSACCHLARTVCRRAERCVVSLHRHRTIENPHILRYLNRLSDLLFVVARMLARETAEKEVMWNHERKKKPFKEEK